MIETASDEHLVAGHLTADDYLTAQRLHIRARTRRFTIVLVCIAAAGVAVTAFDFFYGSIVTGWALGMMIGAVLVRRVLLPQQSRRLFAQQRELQSQFRYSWNATELCGGSATGQSRRPWSNYIKRREDDRLFLLYHNDIMFEMLPKAWFRDAAQVEAFRVLAPKLVD